MKDLLSLTQLSLDEIMELLSDAKLFKEHKMDFKLPNLLIANLFFEPSTRTQYAFHAAELKLDMKPINFSPESSSMKKGETFYDTVKTFEAFGVSAVVIRHSENAYYEQLKGLKIPVINAGDGTGNHPSQSLLDLYTIYEHFGYFKGLKIAFVGDIKHSRVAHSNIEVMQRLGMICFVSGPDAFNESQYPYILFDDAVLEMDIIMLLRIQNERHDVAFDASSYHETFGLTVARVKRMKEDAIIMHPAPFNRGIEIADAVFEDQKSKIFRQIENGVFVRMAIIKRSLS